MNVNNASSAAGSSGSASTENKTGSGGHIR
jgi:hypothetical protein